jgi:hypothetical protein
MSVGLQWQRRHVVERQVRYNPAATEKRRDTAEGLKRRISCIHRMYRPPSWTLYIPAVRSAGGQEGTGRYEGGHEQRSQASHDAAAPHPGY